MLIHKIDAHIGGVTKDGCIIIIIGKYIYIHMDMDLKQIYELSFLHDKSLLRIDIHRSQVSVYYYRHSPANSRSEAPSDLTWRLRKVL